MNGEPDKQLEQQLHAELRALPEIPAPPQLIPQVLARLDSRALKPWWQQSWFAWPTVAQAASLAISLGILAVISFASGEAWFGIRNLWSDSLLREVMISLAQALSTSAKVSLGAWGWQPWVVAGTAVGMIAAMYLVLVGVGTAYYRAFVQRR